MVETSLKTSWEIQTKDKIVFLEDVSESPERVYRMLYHLMEAKKFDEAKAIV